MEKKKKEERRKEKKRTRKKITVIIYLTKKTTDMSEKIYVVGIDPGTRNIGISFYNIFDKEITLFQADLASWSEEGKGYKEYKLTAFEIGALLEDLVKQLKPYFSKTMIGGIEIQPPIGNPLVYNLSLLFKQTLSIMYPTMDMCFVNAKSLRKFWSTHGKDYKERKANSWSAGLFVREDIAKIAFIFKKGRDVKVDALEAALISVYVYHSRKELTLVKSEGKRKFKLLGGVSFVSNYSHSPPQKKRRNDSKKQKLEREESDNESF